MTISRGRPRTALCLVVALAAGCSESSEDRFLALDRPGRPSGGRVAGTAGGTGGAGPASGGVPIDGGAQGGGAPDASPDAVASSGGTRGSGGVDAGTDAAPPEAGPSAIVAYDIRSAEKKLYVLDPETGRPLSSERIGTVRAIVNDGASDRWLVFEQTGTVDGGVTVHIRRLDAATGAFQELGTLPGAPAVFGRPVTFVTAGRSFVAYISQALTAPFSKSDLTVTVVDVSDPAKPAFVPLAGSFPPQAKLALVADHDALGIVIAQAPPSCPAGTGGAPECNVSLVRTSVTSTGVEVGSSSVIDKIGPDGNVELVVDRLRHETVAAFPPLAPPSSPTCGPLKARTTGKVRIFSMSNAPAGASISIPIEARNIAGAAVDSCAGVAFLTTLADDVAIWTVPLAAGSVATRRCVATAGGALYYEASSHSLYRVLTTGELEAYRVDSTGAGTALTPRALDELPAGFRAGAMAVRSPANPTCR